MLKKHLLLVLLIFFLTDRAFSFPVSTHIDGLKPFDWSRVIKVPQPLSNVKEGYQIFHFKTTNKPIEEDKSTYEYVNKYLKSAKILETDSDILKYASDLVHNTEGLIIEFGVSTGRTINFLAALNPKRIIHGFDSFKGLPEDWRERFPRGTFGYLDEDQLPMVLSNVRLHVGEFEDTLPKFIKNINDALKLSFIDIDDRSVFSEKQSLISLIHIDASLYSSTKTIFKYLGKFINKGTIIVFDEYFNYPGWQNHEYKAFQEFVKENNIHYEYVAYNRLHEQVIVRIK